MNTGKIMTLHEEVGVRLKNSKDHDPWMKMNIKVHVSFFHLLTFENQTSLGKRRRGSDEDDPKQAPTEPAES